MQIVKVPELPKTISHYTTLHGLQGIIQTGSLWASNASFLNDKAELQHALRASRQAIRKLSTDRIFKQWKDLLETVIGELEDGAIPDTYVACFCRNDDNLSQWRGYGGRIQGVSVTFDRSKLAERLKRQKAAFFKVRYSRHTTASKLSAALTEELRDIAELDELLGSSTRQERLGDLRSRVSALLPRFKHLGFQDEKEWRFAIQATIKPDKLCFRVLDNKIVPYIVIGAGEDPLPITAIRVGPGPDQELTAQSVRTFLAAKGYDVPIELSDVPYRA